MPTVDKAILVMLSGGLDSTYVLYKYLRETNLPVHAHHISLRVEEENRWRAEDTCVGHIVEHCQQYRTFSYTSNTFDFRLPYTGWDTDIELLVAARVAANLDAESVVVTLGINADDLQREQIIERNNRKVLNNLWSAMLASIDEQQRNRIHPTIHLPFKDVRKADMIREMPLDLTRMTWSCRKPVYAGETAKPCNQCHACISRIEAQADAYEVRRSHPDEFEVVDDPIRV